MTEEPEDESDRIMGIGPWELRGVRREEPVDAFREFNEAKRELGRAVLDTGLGRLVLRFLRWLSAKLS